MRRLVHTLASMRVVASSGRTAGVGESARVDETSRGQTGDLSFNGSVTVRRRLSLIPLLMLALMASAAWIAPATAAPNSEPVIEAARQVTIDNDPTRLFDVPTVVVDPRDPRTVVVAVGDSRNGGCQLRVSHDGGLSWATTAKNLMPSELPYCVHRNTGSYIAPAFASDGTLYVALSGTPASDHPNGPMTALVARSKDLGETHDMSTVAVPRTDITFKNDDGTVETNLIGQHRYASIAVDPGDPNRVYRGWRYGLRGTVVENAAPRQPLVSASNDGGRTWTEPVNVVSPLANGDKIYAGDVPVLVVGNDHTVYSFTKEIQNVAIPSASQGKNRILMSKSTDGAKTWATTVINGGATSVTNPFAAINPRSGALYVTWDQREGTGPQTVQFISSTDGGKIWTDPLRITDDDPGRAIQHYNPGVSVAPNGRVDVAWFDFRNDPFFVPRTATAAPKIRYADIYLASSSDGGKTWTRNLRLTDRAIDTTIGVTFSNFDLRGPVAIASTDDAAYVVWPDSRGGRPDLQSEDAYLTRVRFGDGAEGSTNDSPRIAWAVGGAGGALAIVGALLVLASRRAST